MVFLTSVDGNSHYSSDTILYIDIIIIRVDISLYVRPRKRDGANSRNPSISIASFYRVFEKFTTNHYCQKTHRFRLTWFHCPEAGVCGCNVESCAGVCCSGLCCWKSETRLAAVELLLCRSCEKKIYNTRYDLNPSSNQQKNESVHVALPITVCASYAYNTRATCSCSSRIRKNIFLSWRYADILWYISYMCRKKRRVLFLFFIFSKCWTLY